MKKQKFAGILTTVMAFLISAQVWAATLPQDTSKTVSATLMFAVVILTAVKQFLSVEISKKSLWPSLIILIVAIGGGFNDWLGVVPIGKDGGTAIRLIVSGITFALGEYSKYFFPSPEGKSLQKVTQQLIASKDMPGKQVIVAELVR